MKQRPEDFEMVNPEDPDYEHQLKLADSVKMPSPRILYDLFARQYNRLPLNESMDWVLPANLERPNVVKVLQNRGISATKDFVLRTVKDRQLLLQGMKRYSITKKTTLPCRELLKGDRDTGTLDPRTPQKIAQALGLLHWVKTQAKKKKSFPRLPTAEDATPPPKVLVIQSQEAVDMLKIKLPLGEIGHRPRSKPDSKRRDKQLLAQIKRESQGDFTPPAAAGEDFEIG